MRTASRSMASASLARPACIAATPPWPRATAWRGLGLEDSFVERQRLVGAAGAVQGGGAIENRVRRNARAGPLLQASAFLAVHGLFRACAVSAGSGNVSDGDHLTVPVHSPIARIAAYAVIELMMFNCLRDAVSSTSRMGPLARAVLAWGTRGEGISGSSRNQPAADKNIMSHTKEPMN